MLPFQVYELLFSFPMLHFKLYLVAHVLSININFMSFVLSDKSSEKDPQKGPEVKDTKKNVRDSTYGYCECCSVRYNDLAKVCLSFIDSAISHF